MDAKIINLIDSYIDFKNTIVEYTVLTNKVKDYLKEKNNSTIVEYYSLKLKKIDKSTYDKGVIDYLKDNNLDIFLDFKIDQAKIDELVDSHTLDKDYVIENIEKEKTFLNIKIDGFKEELNSNLKDVEYKLSYTPLINIIKRRELLKHELNRLRYLYYKNAKELKEMMVQNSLDQYRFRYENKLCLLKIITVETCYSEDFVSYIKNNHKDAIITTVKHSELLRTRSKKVNRDIVDRYKIEEYQDYLYVKFLQGLFNKKEKRQNKKI